MRLGLNLAQRIVLVIAWAGLLRIVASYIVSVGNAGGGWFGYAPGTEVVFEPSRVSRGETALVWVAATLLWAIGALWLLRSEERQQRR